MIRNFDLMRASIFAGVAVAGLVAATLPSNAYAQDTAPPADQAQDAEGGVEEIVITAQRRAESLQDVPIAVSAATEEMLDNTGIDSTKDIPSLVPSVQFTRSGASGLLFIRGVGTTNAAVGEESANSLYVDDVYMADLGQMFNNFNNIERIEVLRGPQGTLFGRNATGGLIHIITREPGDEFNFKGEVGYGNYNTGRAQMYIGGPVSNGLSADLAFTGSTQADGWGHNLTTGREVKKQDFFGVRSKIVLRASDAVKFVLSGDYNQNEDNLAIAWKIAPGTIGTGGNLSPSDWNTTSNRHALTEQRVWGVSLKGEFDLGFATLTSVTAYRKTRNHSDFDVDAGPINLVNIAFLSGGTSLQQELRLASNDTEPLAWQVGAFYLRPKVFNDSNLFGLAFAPLSAQHVNAELKTQSYAAFGEATYSITPTTKITGGIRYTKDKRKLEGGIANVLASGVELPPTFNATPELSYSAWTWRVALRQEINDDVNLYASVNKGFKSGSYSLQGPTNPPYLPQKILAYEAGLKSELFGRKLRLNLAVYQYKIDDYQVRSAAVANPGSSIILNAATVKVNGVDLEFDAAPTTNWRLFGGATWLIKSEFSTFGGPGQPIQAPILYPNHASDPNPLNRTRCVLGAAAGSRDPGVIGTGPWTGGWVTCLGDVSGNRTMNAPKLSVSLGTSYTVPVGASGEVRFTALYNYNSGYFFESDNHPLIREPGYHLINASVEYRPTENVGVELWVRNLAKEQYFVQEISSGTGTAAALGAPRTFGVNLKFDF